MNIGELECRDLPLASYWVLQFEHVCKSLWRCGVHFEHRSMALQDLPKGSERVSKDIHEIVQTKLPKRVLKCSEIIWRFINTLRSRLCNKKYSVLSLCLQCSVPSRPNLSQTPSDGGSRQRMRGISATICAWIINTGQSTQAQRRFLHPITRLNVLQFRLHKTNNVCNRFVSKLFMY